MCDQLAVENLTYYVVGQIEQVFVCGNSVYWVSHGGNSVNE